MAWCTFSGFKSCGWVCDSWSCESAQCVDRTIRLLGARPGGPDSQCAGTVPLNSLAIVLPPIVNLVGVGLQPILSLPWVRRHKLGTDGAATQVAAGSLAWAVATSAFWWMTPCVLVAFGAGSSRN